MNFDRFHPPCLFTKGLNQLLGGGCRPRTTQCHLALQPVRQLRRLDGTTAGRSFALRQTRRPSVSPLHYTKSLTCPWTLASPPPPVPDTLQGPYPPLVSWIDSVGCRIGFREPHCRITRGGSGSCRA